MDAGDDTLNQRNPDGRPSDVARVIEQVRSARTAGERLDDQTVISTHAELMPELGLELEKLKRIEAAWAAAALPSDVAAEEPPAPVGPAEIELARALAADLERPVIEVPGYTVLREIGRGGQAVVFLAFKLNPGRRVALKVMRDGSLADDRTLARFQLEAGVLAKLEHRNIVSIIETGQTADGSQYLAMNYIAGCGLDEYMRQFQAKSPDDPGTLLRLFLRICDAVNAAHHLGFVHRDLKPSNIRVDEQGEPHVLDFGLARTARLRTAGGEPVSITGEFLGSLPWSSPEQAEGKPDKIDSRTDVYSLGVILYQMLTGGRFPYEVVGNVRDVLNNIVSSEPTPPSKVIAADLAQRASGPREFAKTHPPAVNEEIERIVLKALGKQPEQRYQNAGELGRAIADYLLGRQISAPAALATKPQRRARGRSSRRRVVVIAATVITLALGGILWQMLSSDGDRMKPSWLFKRLFLALTSSAVVASPAPKPVLAAGPTGSSTSIFDFGNDLASPSTSVQPATRPGIRTDPTAAKPATAPATPPAMADAPTRLRLPTKDEQAAAELLIREAYAQKYADPAPTAKAALAADLLHQADDPSNSPAAQFVLLRDAADVSAGVGDVRTSMTAITAAARRYRLEPAQELKVRAGGMVLAARAATEVEALKDIIGQSLSLSESALRLEQFDTADRLVAAAGVAAAKTKDGALVRSVQDQSRDLNAARVASVAARAAAEVLAKSPADLAANLTLGRYRCLVLGDWDGGLPLLAKGSDPTLKALAARDIAQRNLATAVDTGDGWWDFAEKQQGASKTACQARAGYWYRAALPTLGGLIKARAERRIEIVGSTAGTVVSDAADAPTVAGIAEAGKWIDLFHLIDPQKRVRAGTWKLDHGVLTSSHDNGERIQIPYIPPEEYDYRITFARNEGGNGVVQFASRGDREIIWWIGRDNKHFALNDKTIAQAFSGLENGEKHTSLIKVRHGSVQFFLDDRRILEEDDEHRLFEDGLWYRFDDKRLLGVGSLLSSTSFYSIEVREVSGHGTFLQ